MLQSIGQYMRTKHLYQQIQQIPKALDETAFQTKYDEYTDMFFIT